MKNKITKARSDLRVKVVEASLYLLIELPIFNGALFQVGLPALESEENFPSNGSLIQQNGIKYSSEPELVEGASRRGGGGSVSVEGSQGPEMEGYVNMEAQARGQSCSPAWTVRLYAFKNKNKKHVEMHEEED